MQYTTILYAVQNGIAVITLNRPEVMNALSSRLRSEMLHAVQVAQTEARVMVVTGAGRAFCAGQDLGDAAAIDDLDLERLLNDEYVPLLKAITDSTIPTIAAVNGVAAGAGAGLALAADVVIASESASFIQAFTRNVCVPSPAIRSHLPLVECTARTAGISVRRAMVFSAPRRSMPIIIRPRTGAAVAAQFGSQAVVGVVHSGYFSRHNAKTNARNGINYGRFCRKTEGLCRKRGDCHGQGNSDRRPD